MDSTSIWDCFASLISFPETKPALPRAPRQHGVAHEQSLDRLRRMLHAPSALCSIETNTLADSTSELGIVKAWLKVLLRNSLHLLLTYVVLTVSAIYGGIHRHGRVRRQISSESGLGCVVECFITKLAPPSRPFVPCQLFLPQVAGFVATVTHSAKSYSYLNLSKFFTIHSSSKKTFWRLTDSNTFE